MKAIGGYFELSLPDRGKPFHDSALALNTGGNAFEYALRTKPDVTCVLLPYYICDTMLDPLVRLNIPWRWYLLDTELLPVLENELGDNEVLLVVNYFGLMSETMAVLVSKHGRKLIVDNTQAFFSPPLPGIDTFYSARKFFGVPDGAYLYSDRSWNQELPQDASWERCSHLLKRWDMGAEGGYRDFLKFSELLRSVPPRRMSPLTSALLRCIDYKAEAQKRVDNFAELDARLRPMNDWTATDLDHPGEGPMVYPFLVEDGGKLKQYLIDKRVYVATYWPSVLKHAPADAGLERKLAENLVCLPIDSRYDSSDMLYVLGLVQDWLNDRK